MFVPSPEDSRRIHESILAKYEKVALSPQGQFRYPTGREGLSGLDYPPELLARLPESALDCFAGVGNPLSLGQISPGQSVLDIGCGCGTDSLLAALLAAPGQVHGIELSSAMLAKAKQNQQASSISNLELRQGSAESLPYPDFSFDTVISNGVFNLIIDKPKALAEAWRVLKPSGQLLLADQILESQVPLDPKDAVSSWFT